MTTNLQQQFEHYSNLIRNAPTEQKQKIDNNTKLKLYIYYKQSTIGDINIPKPNNTSLLSSFSPFQNEAEIKWDGWNSLKGISKDESMKTYIMLAKQLIN